VRGHDLLPSAQIPTSRSDGTAPARGSRCGRMPAPNDDAAQGKKASHGVAMRRGAEDRSCRPKGGLSFASRTGATQAVGGSTVRVLDERRIRQFSQSFIRSAFPK
jgi:hypothetical protein